VIGHARYLIERIGPELRQYVVAGNDEERPFSRDQRRWVYASAKLENNYFGFGTDNDIEHMPGYVIIKHRTFGPAAPPTAPHVGGARVAALREGARVPRAGGGRRSAGLGREHLRDELRGTVGQRRHRAEPRCRARGLPAEHRRGRHLALSTGSRCSPT
jgi:hypothetical protein